MDKRIVNTKQKLNDASLELFSLNGYSKVSINDICTKANIKRPTFYNHYVDKNDYIEKTLDERFIKIGKSKKISSYKTFNNYFLTLFEGYLNDISLYRSNLNNLKKESIDPYITEYLFRSIKKNLSSTYSLFNTNYKDSIVIDLLMDSYSGLFITFLIKYITHLDLTLEEIIDSLKLLLNSNYLPLN